MDIDYKADEMDVDHDNPSEPFISRPEPGSESIGIDPEDLDPNDELLYAMPVYFSQQLVPYIHLFQYPVRVVPFTPETGPIAARVKPKAQMFEVDLPLNVHGETYSDDKGEQFAMGTNDEEIKTAFDRITEEKEWGPGGSSGAQKKKDFLDKQTLTSLVVPPQTKYYVGVVRAGELHLTAIERTVQLRPVLRYLDKIDEKHKSANKRIYDEENKEEKERRKAETDRKASAVQLSVKTNNNDQPPRKNIYSSQHRFAEDESWTKLGYYDEMSKEANVIYERMFATDRQELQCKTKISAYVDMISARSL